MIEYKDECVGCPDGMGCMVKCLLHTVMIVGRRIRSMFYLILMNSYVQAVWKSCWIRHGQKCHSLKNAKSSM